MSGPGGQPTEPGGGDPRLTRPHHIPRTAAEMVQALRTRLDAQDHELHTTRQAAHALREAILPLRLGPDHAHRPAATTLTTLTTQVAVRSVVRYIPVSTADAVTGLGGDWFDAAPLPGGRTLLAVGDVSGHGDDAVARMNQLRHALLGLAMTGGPPGLLLHWLNALVLNRRDDTIATVVAGVLDPAGGEFAWAQAGHPAPILIRGRRARQLAAPTGILLGADRQAVFTTAQVRVRPGDVLLLFTDGLAERRDRDLSDGVALTLQAAGRFMGEDLDADLDFLLDAVGGPNQDDDTCVLAVTILGR